MFSKKDFIESAVKKHGNKYDYSHGCAHELMSKNKLLNAETFIKKAVETFGDKYDYSHVDYKRSSIKVKIGCLKHGLYEVTPNNFLRKMGGCPICAKISRPEKRRSNTQDFVDKAKKTHGTRYDYSLIDYVDNSVGVKIICPTHGVFVQQPSVHLVGKGCRQCSDDKHRLDTQKFIKRAKEVHGDLFDYSLVDYAITRKPVKIICRKHGVFEQIANGHLKGNGCPFCLESRGERKIASFLDSYHVPYVREQTFEGCRNKYPLFFDFFIPKLNICIEYDGQQHFHPYARFGGVPVFEQTKKSDVLKNNFCSKKGIKLIRIPYNKKDPEIFSLLEKELGLANCSM